MPVWVAGTVITVVEITVVGGAEAGTETDTAVVGGVTVETTVVGGAEAGTDTAVVGVTVIVACAETGEILFPGSLTVAVFVMDPVAFEATVTGTVMVPMTGFATPATGGTKLQVMVLTTAEQLDDAKPLPDIVGVPFRLKPAGKVSVTVACALIVPVKAPAMVKLSEPPGETVGCVAALVRVTDGALEGAVVGWYGVIVSDALTGGAPVVHPLSETKQLVRVAVLVIPTPTGPVAYAVIVITGNWVPASSIFAVSPVHSTVP